ncbi:STAS domain-containing protein [Halioxenophilus aromaticivorans]|uniref:STAS domain-containing protein n=1 Tax=Halioxenophilus aromaticivorans TaxID=1306992 RepID=A0AAV3TZ40_9ALTE
MQPGHIFVAQQRGINVIKMVGDVRLTLCISFDSFIEQMFSDAGFVSVVFDLRQALALDSTTLGLMAKIAITCERDFHFVPTVVSPDESINRVLESMGLEDIFEIVRSADTTMAKPEELTRIETETTQAKDKIIEAHKILMSLNDENKAEFRDLVECLEQE